MQHREKNSRWRSICLAGVLWSMLAATCGATSRASIREGGSVFPEYESEHPVQPPAGVWKTEGPKHTNAWWVTLGIGKGNGVFTALPYAHTAQKDGVSACTMSAESTAAAAVHPCASMFQLSWASSTSDKHTIVGYDDLSVTIEFPQTGVSFPIVHGQPFLTAAYSKAVDHAPRIKFFNDVASWDAERSVVTDSAGQQFLCFASTTQGAWQQTASDSLVFTPSDVEGDSDSEPLWVRVGACGGAFPSCDVLREHVHAIPVGGAVSYTVSGRFVQYSFEFELASTSSAGNSSLLMMALVHHRTLFSSTSPPSLLPDCTAASPRGPMQCVAGKRWVMSGELPKETWNTLLDARDCTLQADIQHQISTMDVFTDDGSQPGDSVYWYGKRLFELARLVAIADGLHMDEERFILVSRLYTRLVPLLDNSKVPHPDWEIVPWFAYESTWGGVVNHLAPEDAAVDFGQGYYNDHHLQYGYVLYAAAVLAKFHPTFVKEYDAHVRDVIRDIANPVADEHFPAFRVFDWYCGHSWAGGLFEGDRNQESSSEAVNAWYAIWLYGLATDAPEIESVGAALLLNEVVAAQHYYQISDQSAVYSPPFSDNKVVGVLYGSYALYDTHFGSKPEYIHLIQFVPFSPITEYLIPQEWVSQQFAVLQPIATGSWQELVYMNEAMVNPMSAYQHIQALPDNKLGLSTRASLLHWAATRPGWPPAGSRCSKTIRLDNPTEPYPYCVTLRQLAVAVDPAASSSSSSSSSIALAANGFPMAGTEEGDAILCAGLDNSTHRLVFSKSFKDSTGVAEFVSSKLEDGDILVLATLGATLDDATTQLVQEEFDAILTRRGNGKLPYVLVAERNGRVFMEQVLPSKDKAQTVTTSIQCTPEVLLTGGCFDVEAYSAGYDDGKGGYIRVDGEFVIPTSVGMNAVIFDKTTMNVKAYGTFNTYASMAQSETMAVWLDSVASSGDVLVLIVQDEAASRLESTLIHALQTLYAASSIDKLGFRDSYVLISAKNAATPLHEVHRRSGRGSIKISAPLPCASRSYKDLARKDSGHKVSTVTAIIVTLSIFFIQLFV